MNVIPLASLIGPAAPTTAGIKSFNNPYDPATGGVPSAYVGYAMQGVNSTSAGTTGKVVAESLYYYTDIAYDIKDVGTVAATLANGNYLDNTAFSDPTGPARQPNAIPDLPTAGSAFTSNDRVVDNLDARIGSSVYEANGKIYSVQTVSDDASDTSKVRLTVINAATNTILSETDIGDGVHDFYQGLALDQQQRAGRRRLQPVGVRRGRQDQRLRAGVRHRRERKSLHPRRRPAAAGQPGRRLSQRIDRRLRRRRTAALGRLQPGHARPDRSDQVLGDRRICPRVQRRGGRAYRRHRRIALVDVDFGDRHLRRPRAGELGPDAGRLRPDRRRLRRRQAAVVA